MEPMNSNPQTQNFERRRAKVVHGYWNGRPVDKYGAIVMIPTPNAGPSPGSHQNQNQNQNQMMMMMMETPAAASNWNNHMHVVISPAAAANNTSNPHSNDHTEVQQYAAYGERLGVLIPKPNNNNNAKYSPMVARGACVIQQFNNYLRDCDRCSKNNASEDWKKFVAHYYAPEAKRFCCQAVLLGLSAHNYSCNSQGTSTCRHCQIKSNKSQEVSFSELAISFQHKFTQYRKEDQFVEHGQFKAWKAGNNTVLYFNDVVEIAQNDQFLYLWKGRLAVQFKADMKFCVSTSERVDRSDAIACSKLKQRFQNARGSSRERGSEPTLMCQKAQKQPVSNSSISGAGGNEKEVTSASTASGIRPNALMNPLPGPGPGPGPGPSDSNNKKRKRAAPSTEIAPANKNNMGSTSTAKADQHWSGMEILDTWDPVEIDILESLVHSMASSSASTK